MAGHAGAPPGLDGLARALGLPGLPGPALVAEAPGGARTPVASLEPVRSDGHGHALEEPPYDAGSWRRASRSPRRRSRSRRVGAAERMHVLLGDRVRRLLENDELVDRAPGEGSRGHRGRRGRRSRSRSSESVGSRGDPDPRVRGQARLLRIARQKPGALAAEGLSKMSGYLRHRDGHDPLGGGSREELPPVMQAYLGSVYFPVHSEQQVGLRSAREMRTLAMINDLICSGRVLSALDVVMQRQKALEISIEQGGWTQGRWLELIPQSDASTWTREDLRDAMREQDLEARLGLGAAGRRRGPSPRRSPSRRGGGQRGKGGGDRYQRWQPQGFQKGEHRRRDQPRRRPAGRSPPGDRGKGAAAGGAAAHP